MNARRPRRKVIGCFHYTGFQGSVVILECGHRSDDRTGKGSALCRRCSLGEPPEFSMRDKVVQVRFAVTLDRKGEILPVDEKGDTYTKWVLSEAFRLVEKAINGEGKMGVEMLDVTQGEGE